MFLRVVPVAMALTAGCRAGRTSDATVPAVLGTVASPPRSPLAMVMPAPSTPPAPVAPVEPFSGTLTFVPGSTGKVDTLIGDVDRETGEPTLSLTETRYGIVGTDLGSSFEHDGRAWFLFGDTLGARMGDTLATTTAASGDDGVRLDFLTEDDGDYLRVRPDGVSMGGFEVPVAGLSLDGEVYVAVKTGHVLGEQEDVSVLTRFDEDVGRFTRLRDVSALPDGRFIKMSLREAPPGIEGQLPGGGPWVLMWGTGRHRESDAYLAIVPADGFASGEGTLYWAGDGPRWSSVEADAVPVVEHPTMGDLSVTWVEDLGVWLMVYDSREPRGVLARWSPTPWGPWTEPQTLFAHDDGVAFIHEPGEDDGLAGPMIGDHDDPMEEHGGAYAPYVVERFTRVEEGVLTVWYTLSTWNPYLVVLLRSELAISQ